MGGLDGDFASLSVNDFGGAAIQRAGIHADSVGEVLAAQVLRRIAASACPQRVGDYR